MNRENIQGYQDMGSQVITKRQIQGKHGEIFTLRFVDRQQIYVPNSRLCGGGSIESGAGYKRMDADKCEPDLFFDLWDFSDTPQELELD